jgi:hypothetical protein
MHEYFGAGVDNNTRTAAFRAVSKERIGDDGMSSGLTDSQVALLCDIREWHFSKLTSDQKSDLQRLISEGYAESADGDTGSQFKLTAKGSQFLGERGAGLNEA